jgi:hypothetical protein
MPFLLANNACEVIMGGGHRADASAALRPVVLPFTA